MDFYSIIALASDKCQNLTEENLLENLRLELIQNNFLSQVDMAEVFRICKGKQKILFGDSYESDMDVDTDDSGCEAEFKVISVEMKIYSPLDLAYETISSLILDEINKRLRYSLCQGCQYSDMGHPSQTRHECIMLSAEDRLYHYFDLAKFVPEECVWELFIKKIKSYPHFFVNYL